MNDYKAIINFKDKKSNKLFKLLKKVYYNSLYHLVYNFQIIYEKTKRAISYAKFGYSNPDWDSAYLYTLMGFKLKRIKIVLSNGIAIQENEDIEALQEAIDICQRLYDDNYDEKYYEQHELKWGKRINSRDSLHFFNSRREKVITEEDKKQEMKEQKQVWKTVEKDHVADFKRLGKILEKHSRRWWE